MSLFKKLFTFGRAIKAEMEEEFTAAQAIRLLEQHIRDARQAMDVAGRLGFARLSITTERETESQ